MSPDSELRKPARVWAATILLTTASVGSPLFLWIATESPARPVAAVGIVLAAASIILSFSTAVLIWRDARLLGPLSAYFFSLLSVFSFVSGFAILHWRLSISDQAAYSVPLDKSASIYYTLTVFTTTGFGDIYAKSPVTAQPVGDSRGVW